MNVRVLDNLGSGATSTIIAGLQWVVANKTAYNIRVINLSLGHAVGESYHTDPLCQAVEAAYKAGIVVVCSAGNQGRQQNTVNSALNNEGYGANYGSVDAPANDPYVITVGAMKSMDGKRADDRIATYSSRGPSYGDMVLKPDLVAPGNKIISLRSPGSTLDVNYGSDQRGARQQLLVRPGEDVAVLHAVGDLDGGPRSRRRRRPDAASQSRPSRRTR